MNMARPFDQLASSSSTDRGVSIAQVAAHAGVSVATVSRVLNGNQAVKEQTRVRVSASIQAMGYRVNQLARSLRTDESRVLLRFYESGLEGYTYLE